MTEVKDQLDRIEKTVVETLKLFKIKNPPVETKWLTEPQAMELFNLTKRGISVLRRKNIFRVSTGTGRNFLYYKPDVEEYIYANSAVRKRRINTNRKGGKKD